LKPEEFVIDEELAEQFDSYMKKYKEIYQNLAKTTLNNIPKSVKNPVIVDLGMGTGLLSVELNKLVPNAEVIGLDPSENMIRLAKENFIENNCKQCKAINAKAENTTLKPDSVDIIVSRLSLSSWEKPKQCFEELHRILKPGRRLILEGLNKDFPQWRLVLNRFHMLFNKAGKRVIDYHINFYKNAYNLSQAEKFLINTNFKIIEKKSEKKGWNFFIIAEKT